MMLHTHTHSWFRWKKSIITGVSLYTHCSSRPRYLCNVQEAAYKRPAVSCHLPSEEGGGGNSALIRAAGRPPTDTHTHTHTPPPPQTMAPRASRGRRSLVQQTAGEQDPAPILPHVLRRPAPRRTAPQSDPERTGPDRTAPALITDTATIFMSRLRRLVPERRHTNLSGKKKVKKKVRLDA